MWLPDFQFACLLWVVFLNLAKIQQNSVKEGKGRREGGKDRHRKKREGGKKEKGKEGSEGGRETKGTFFGFRTGKKKLQVPYSGVTCSLEEQRLTR